MKMDNIFKCPHLAFQAFGAHQFEEHFVLHLTTCPRSSPLAVGIPVLMGYVGLRYDSHSLAPLSHIAPTRESSWNPNFGFALMGGRNVAGRDR
jgi:hypothetical protein